MDGVRALPEQPSLRHLKLEAKRRLAAGEFSTLHGSQLAIAREHGQPSRTALKAAVDVRGAADGRAVEQLRWIAARFGDAAEHGWTAPGTGCGCGRRWRGIDLIRSNLERLNREVPCRFPPG